MLFEELTGAGQSVFTTPRADSHSSACQSFGGRMDQKDLGFLLGHALAIIAPGCGGRVVAGDIKICSWRFVCELLKAIQPYWPPVRPPFDYNAYSKRLEDLFIRLKSAGVRVENTRLDAYRKAIANFDKVANENRLREWAGTEKIALLYNDLQESQKILEACDQFDDLTKPGLLTRLEKVFSGQRVLADETSEKAEARNVLFELVVAARLKKAGFEVDLDRIEDIRFPLWDRPCFAECKRIRSANLLKRRIQEAPDQIGRRCDGAGTSSVRGIIAIDVSKIESRDDFLLVCRADEEVGLEIRRHLKTNSSKFEGAIAACHEALKEFTPQCSPLDWAS